MFGRGSWAVFGVKKATEESFVAGLNNFAAVSQASALEKTKKDALPVPGINPYAYPRFDEGELDLDVTVAEFKLSDSAYALWFCLNDFEDVTDPKSKQEGLAYDTATKPFKFLKKEEKTHVESLVQASAVMARKQFPVLIDFVGERVYAETTNAEEIGALRVMLENLGAQTYNMSWQFDGYDWTIKFLNTVQANNKFHKAMADRASELQRFRADEVEKLEDKMLEAIVSGYFAMSELETGQWAGLSTPAKIRLFGTSEPSAESNVSTAFTLLGLVSSAQVASASVVFQQLDSRFNKKGEEKQVRQDLFTIDINDKVNISDAGAASLRGFDMPQYKRDMKRHGKDRGALTIKDYWMEWLVGMKTSINFFSDNVTEALKIDKNLGLLPYEAEQAEAAEV